MKQLIGYMFIISGVAIGILFLAFKIDENTFTDDAYYVLGFGALFLIITGIVILYKSK